MSRSVCSTVYSRTSFIFQNRRLPLPPRKPPNVVIFLVDDMGVMDTSLPFLTMPPADRSGIR